MMICFQERNLSDPRHLQGDLLIKIRTHANSEHHGDHGQFFKSNLTARLFFRGGSAISSLAAAVLDAFAEAVTTEIDSGKGSAGRALGSKNGKLRLGPSFSLMGSGRK
jgi:hypothetical protein